MMNEGLEQELRQEFEWFHRHPELSYQEFETTKRIREFLKRHKIEMMEDELETGVVAVIRGKKEGIVRLLRADIDALPLTELTNLPYRSEIEGRMHACGHDFHIVTGLGCAVLLQEKREELSGTVKIVFQPAEESARGALKITETTLIEDAVHAWGFHADPTNPVGTIGIRDGYVAAAADKFQVHITGVGCHGAHPDTGIDPIPVAAAIIQAFQTVITRNVDPFHPALISVTRVQAGSTWNVIPESAEMEGTVRTMNKEDRILVERRMREITEQIASGYGAVAKMSWTAGSPAVYNEKQMALICSERAKELGLLTVPEESSMGGDDFSFYTEKIPGCYVKIGTGVGPAIHQPQFAVDQKAIQVATLYMTAVLMQDQ